MKRVVLVSIFFGLLLVSSRTAARADIYNCDGRWTNKACGEKALPAFEEQVVKENEKPSQSLDVQKSLLHDLTMKSLQARREYDLKFDLGGARDLCLSAGVELSKCRDKIELVSDRIDEKVAKAIEREEKTRKEIEEERVKENYGVAIVVRERRRFNPYNWRRFLPGIPRDNPRPNLTPKAPVVSGSNTPRPVVPGVVPRKPQGTLSVSKPTQRRRKTSKLSLYSL